MPLIPMRKVFVSCTTADLWQYREEAMQVINELNDEYEERFHLGKATMDTKLQTGRGETPVNVSTNWVSQSDWIVLIVAWNYGSVPKGQEYSVTECEYQQAKKESKDCFVFIAGETNDSVRYARKDEGREKVDLVDWHILPKEESKQKEWLEKQKKLEEFKKHLRESHCTLFSDLEDFCKKLKDTLKSNISE